MRWLASRAWRAGRLSPRRARVTRRRWRKTRAVRSETSRASNVPTGYGSSRTSPQQWAGRGRLWSSRTTTPPPRLRRPPLLRGQRRAAGASLSPTRHSTRCRQSRKRRASGVRARYASSSRARWRARARRSSTRRWGSTRHHSQTPSPSCFALRPPCLLAASARNWWTLRGSGASKRSSSRACSTRRPLRIARASTQAWWRMWLRGGATICCRDSRRNRHRCARR
mmetsp:Transcript_19646/g.49963  ORF Transcript_19646/g.49963 Transcript_19646/m.49963 type:complete len:225 (-) Transcript_19646:610-1284(-)